jgi:hypothetical protein
MFQALEKSLLSTALLAVLAPAALADGFGIAVGRGGFSIGFSTGPSWSPAPPPPCPPPACPPPCWVPGHYETVCRPVYVAGCEERAWVPARYGWMRDPYGRAFWGCVEPGRFVRTRRPGHYENRDVRVWVAGAWR